MPAECRLQWRAGTLPTANTDPARGPDHENDRTENAKTT